MSMNQYMHPRNIYKQPPDFKQLAIEYPEFRKYASQDISGKVTVDFKNVEALRALSRTLLKKDFNLDMELPLNKLIPTIPLRLNYILWIEDLLSVAGRSENIKGVDIGTGASCVYPALAAKTNNWAMVATEIDSDSVKFATENIARNCLQSLVKVLQVSGESLLGEVFEHHSDTYDFCMCNPPFFATTQELHPFFKARKQNRSHPRNAFCASVDEVVAKGGEVEYITKLINESKTLGAQVRIYSTMVGHKSSLPLLKKRLREVEVISFKQTEFCQGHTTRWGLAWSFADINLTKIPDSLVAAKQKLVKPLYYEVPKLENYKLSTVVERLVAIFNELEIEHREIKHSNVLVEFLITAVGNTWSHQRRKRRERLRHSTDNNNDGVHSACDKLAELNCNASSTKRGHDDEDEGFYSNVKKMKTGDCGDVYLKAKIGVMKVEACIGLELTFFEGTGTKDALHQVLQYVKNSFAKL